MAVFDLKHFDYHTIKDMSASQEADLAEAVRKEIITQVSASGGHLSSNLGVVELTISLLKVFDPAKDDILFDVGHQCYAFKILTGRDLSSLRRKGGVSGFQVLNESPYDRFESGHSSTSIAAALGIAAAKKRLGDDSFTVAVIGDASFANGLAMEALNSIDDKVYGKIIIILNDNNMSISKPHGALSRFFNRIRTSSFYQEGAGSFKKAFDHNGLRWIYKGGRAVKNFTKKVFTQPNFFDSFACSYLGPIDGHDLKKCASFLKRAKSIDHSVILHVRTKKGKGYALAEEDEEGYWHGTGAFDPESGLPLNAHPELLSFSHAAGDEVLSKLKDDPKAVLISAAMQKGAHLEEAFKAFPSRCFDVGIAEDEAVSLASGLALKGFHPLVSMYSTFLQRAYDEILNDICRMHLPVVFLVDRVGLIGADGSSHQGIFDAALAASMPSATVVEPHDLVQVHQAIREADFTFKGPYFIRLERAFGEKKELEDASYLSSKMAEYAMSGEASSSQAIILVGQEGKQAFKDLQGKENAILLTKIRPINPELRQILVSKQDIYFYDSTSIEEGNPAMVFSALVDSGFAGRAHIRCVPKTFVEHMSKEEQLTQCQLDEKALKDFLPKGGN